VNLTSIQVFRLHYTGGAVHGDDLPVPE
jgi:hypothetical protein